MLRECGWDSLTLYTDGTCAHPTIPAARHAACAVIADVSTHISERNRGMDFWKAEGILPPCFQVWAQGLVHHRQTIARAELTAALQAVRRAAAVGSPPCTIVTDSTCVIRVCSELARGGGTQSLIRSASFDLVLLLGEVWYPALRALKVKCHVSRADAMSSPDLWHILGNTAADQACEQALQQDFPLVRELTDELAEQYEVQEDQLRVVYAFYIDLDKAVQRQRTRTEGIQEDAASSPDLVVAATLGAAFIQLWIQAARASGRALPCGPRPRGSACQARGVMTSAGRCGIGL